MVASYLPLSPSSAFLVPTCPARGSLLNPSPHQVGPGTGPTLDDSYGGVSCDGWLCVSTCLGRGGPSVWLYRVPGASVRVF